ncbi:MAG: OmpW family outer membrane protein [Pseudomonadota bacterium]
MKRVLLALFTSAVAIVPLAKAQSQGDITVGLGVGVVDPKSDNGTLAGGQAVVSTNTQFTITAEYFILENLGVELLAATPFSHDVNIAGVGFAGNVNHLPPTLSLNYHFPETNGIKPYVGIGANYTLFFDEQSPLGNLELDDSFGFAAQAGIDFSLSETTALRANVRWVDIDSDVTLNGVNIGTAEIDPFIYTAAFVVKF